jgi:hypothetical protein
MTRPSPSPRLLRPSTPCSINAPDGPLAACKRSGNTATCSFGRAMDSLAGTYCRNMPWRSFFPIVFLPFVVFMGIRTAQEHFLLFLAAHLLVAAVGIVLMREKWRHLWIVPVYRVVYEPLRAYLLYTAVYTAARGVRAGWKKLSRTGTLDSGVAAVAQSEHKSMAPVGAVEQ